MGAERGTVWKMRSQTRVGKIIFALCVCTCVCARSRVDILMNMIIIAWYYIQNHCIRYRTLGCTAECVFTWDHLKCGVWLWYSVSVPADRRGNRCRPCWVLSSQAVQPHTFNSPPWLSRFTAGQFSILDDSSCFVSASMLCNTMLMETWYPIE